jgi:cyanate permease
VLLMSIDVEWTFIVGMTIALGIGWGWPGLTHFVVSRAAGAATPSATGIVQTGSYIGSGAGPLLFGLFFTFLGDTGLWLVVGAVQIVAAAIAFLLSRRAASTTELPVAV